jgi:protein-tyrosine phosphatase
MDVKDIAPDYRMTENWGIRTLYTEMLPGLWMGGTLDRDVVGIMASVNKEHGTYTSPVAAGPEITADQFDAVVTLYHCARPVGLGVEELRFGILDDAREDEPVGFNELALADAVDWAYTRWSTGQRVLIRCQAGLNRSGLVTALVMMDSGMSLDQALTIIRDRRSQRCLHNKHFIKYLRTVEEAVATATSS